MTQTTEQTQFVLATLENSHEDSGGRRHGDAAGRTSEWKVRTVYRRNNGWPQMDVFQLVAGFEQFCGSNLTSSLSRIEASLRGATLDGLQAKLAGFNASKGALAAAGELKRVAGQVNVVIHALGILLCLPHILEADETVQYVSLGAGNTGRQFDLETDRRVAEFKFIQWQGGPETIRQNSLFKDFYLLAEYSTPKLKCLYVLETERPLRFLNGGRALPSVLKDARLAESFRSQYGDRYRTVREYFQPRQSAVTIQDVSGWLSGLGSIDIDADAHAV